MNYDVLWTSPAEQQLATIWMTSPDRDEITRIVDALDRQFRRDPHAIGESREGVARIVIDGPIVVLLDVDEGQRLVLVQAIWQPRRRA